MCECSKIHLYEVEFKLAGMIVVPTHKNCGDKLNEKQADTFQKELVKTWGLEEEEELTLTIKKPIFQNCKFLT